MLRGQSAFRRLILLAAVIGALTARLPVKASNNYAFLFQLGSQGVKSGEFEAPAGIAADGYGNIYVVDYTNQTVQRFDRYGNFLTKFSIAGTTKAVAVDLEGNLFIADIQNNRAQKFDGNGRLLLSFGSEGAGNGQFESPQGIAVDSHGDVFVSDTGNNRIEKFDSYGNYLLQFGSSAPSAGSGNGQFNGPRRLAVDSSGNVFVPDTVNNRIEKFDNYGNYLAQWGSSAPTYSSGSGNGQFNLPFAVAVDGSGNVYVADQGNYRIQKFDNNGAYLAKFGSEGGGNGQFTTLSGLAVDSNGHVFASDFSLYRVEVFAQTPTTSASFTPSSYTGGTLNLTVSNGPGSTTALTVDGITQTSPYVVRNGTPHIAIFQSTDGSGNVEDPQVFYFSAAPFPFSVTPDLIASGSGATTFTVSGVGFDSTCRITVNGTPITTTTRAGSGTGAQQTLIASVPSSYFTSAGSADVTVTYGTPAAHITDDLIVLIGKVSLALSAVLSTDANGNAFVALTLKNSGTLDATSVQIDGVAATQPTKLNGSDYTATTFPTSSPYATAPMGASYTGTLTFPAAGLTTASKVPLKVHGAFASGAFSATIDLTVPLTVSNIQLSRATDGTDNIVASITFSNNSGASVGGGKIKGATLADPTTATTASPVTALPVAVGTIAAHGTATVTLTFPAAIGNSGDSATLTLSGGCIDFSSGVILP